MKRSRPSLKNIMSKSKHTQNAQEAQFLQFVDDIPLAARTKTEALKHNRVKELTKELDEASWHKANRLVKGEWFPFADDRWECFAHRKFGTHGGIGSPLRLIYEFKRAVLSQKWSNALKLADCIFKNYHTFIQRTHIKVMLTILLSHPEMNEAVISDLCSFLWKVEGKEKKKELLRCFCSLPKSVPAESLHETSHATGSTVFKRSKDKVTSKLKIQYTAHIGKHEDNDMYVE